MRRLFITFNVSVDLPFRVQILQSLKNFPQYCGDVRLFKRPWTELRQRKGPGCRIGRVRERWETDNETEILNDYGIEGKLREKLYLSKGFQLRIQFLLPGLKQNLLLNTP